jgi:hypothetical protein
MALHWRTDCRRGRPVRAVKTGLLEAMPLPATASPEGRIGRTPECSHKQRFMGTRRPALAQAREAAVRFCGYRIICMLMPVGLP